MVYIRATHVVPSAEPNPNGMMYLNACDQINDITHTPTIYFYKNSAALEEVNIVSRLKDSLSKSLVLFYQLAGRLNWAEEGGSLVELPCNGKGVLIFEAESDAKVEDFWDFTPNAKIKALNPFRGLHYSVRSEPDG